MRRESTVAFWLAENVTYILLGQNEIITSNPGSNLMTVLFTRRLCLWSSWLICTTALYFIWARPYESLKPHLQPSNIHKTESPDCYHHQTGHLCTYCLSYRLFFSPLFCLCVYSVTWSQCVSASVGYRRMQYTHRLASDDTNGVFS